MVARSPSDETSRGADRRLVEPTRRALAGVLGSAGFVEKTPGADLFTIALFLARREPLTIERASDVLESNGAPASVDRAALSGRLAMAVRATHGILSYGGLWFGYADRQVVTWRFEAIWGRADVQARARLATAPKRAEAKSIDVQPLLPTPPWIAAPRGVAEVPLEALAAFAASRPAPLVDLALALAAHDLAAVASFEDLLALALLVGVASYAYQLETVRRVLRVMRGRALLADEVGLGKTIEAILLLREYQLRGMVRRALVIVPAPLVRMWHGELLEKAGVEARTTEDARCARDPEAFWREDGVVVASLSRARSAKHAPLVQAEAWDLVIVDEAHHMKTRTTLGYKLVDGLRSRFLLLLTATPIETDLEEIYNLITLLRPGQFATPAAFRKEYVDPKDPTAPKNRERLRALLGEVMVRNTRAESGLALPPRWVTTVVIEPTAEERMLYEAIVALYRAHAGEPRARLAAATLLLEAGSSIDAVRGTLARLREGAKQSPAFLDGARRIEFLAHGARSSRKAERLVELVRAHGGHALVFTRFRETALFLAETLAEAGLRVGSFHGGQSAADKHAAIERFRAERSVLVATDVGGEGQNLQFCSLLVNFDIPWNPMLIEQRIGRLHRMGQRDEVHVYNLCAAGTVEERLLDVLDGRVHLFELVVGELDMILGDVASEDDFESRILAMVAEAKDDAAIARGFDELAADLLAARGRVDRARALDEALFGRDFEA
jgi:superfamily II DNA or RNA helicase